MDRVIPGTERELGATGAGRHWKSTISVGLAIALTTAGFGLTLPGMLLTPLLFAWLRLRSGNAGTLWGFGIGLASVLILRSASGGTALVIWGLTGTLLAWGSERGWAARRTLVLSASPLVVLSGLQAAAIASAEAKTNFLENLRGAVEEAARMNSALGLGPEELARARDMVARAGELVWLVTPALSLIWAGILCFVVYRLGQWGFPRFGFGVELVPVAPFRTWALGEKFAWLLVLGLVLEVSRAKWAMATGHNVLMVVGFAYMVQGAAIVRHQLETRRISRLGQVLVWIAGLVLLQPVSGILAVAAGFLDSWVHFRERLGPDHV